MAASAPLDGVLSHWSTLIENMQQSPLQFYEAVEAALRQRQLPETMNSRIDYRESGLLSAHREYLHVTREKLVFDICGAPFGNGFFVSWWLVQDKVRISAFLKAFAVVLLFALIGWALNRFGLFGGLVAIAIVVPGGLMVANGVAEGGGFDDDFIRVLPLIGPLYSWLFKPATFYRIDTMEMYQKAVHNAVLEVLDSMTAAHGLRVLSESERKPIMREFYQR
jgi:hypothetical protein